MSTAITPIKPEEAISSLEKLTEQYGPKAMVSLSTVAKSLKLAEGIRMTREVIRRALPLVRDLAGTKLGFRTDQDNKGGGTKYDDATLVDCLTEAALRGVSWVGNEFNIIAGNTYITKEGFSRLVCEIEGLADYNPVPGVPSMKDGGAVVPMKATWKLNGKEDYYERLIPVKLNNGMGVDGAIGKAFRKLHASVHYKLTASAQSAFDAETDPTENDEPIGSSSAQELANKLKAGPVDGPRVVTAESVDAKKPESPKPDQFTELLARYGQKDPSYDSLFAAFPEIKTEDDILGAKKVLRARVMDWLTANLRNQQTLVDA